MPSEKRRRQAVNRCLLGALLASVLVAPAEAATASLTRSAGKQTVLAGARATLSRVATAVGTPSATAAAAAAASLVCDGATDNTKALAALYAAYQGSAGSGYQITLPSGTCNFSSTLDWLVNKPLTIIGAGGAMTTLDMTASATDAIRLTVTNGADLTLQGFAIGKTASMPSGALFANKALVVASESGTDAGQLVISNMWIEGAGETDVAHGWATGLELVDLARPVIDNLNVKNASGANASGSSLSGVPMPASGGTTPGSLAPGVGTDIWIHGSQNMAIDTSLTNTRTDGGITAVDVDMFQGLYIQNGDFVYSDYGIRSDLGQGPNESLSVTNSLINTVIGGVYLYGVAGVEISSNLISVPGAPFSSPSYQAIWMRDAGQVTISSNNISAPNQPDAGGVAFSGDPGNAFTGFPSTISDNTFFTLSGTCIFNDAHYDAITGTGNSAEGCGTFLTDLNGNNDYFDNTFQYPDVYSDGNRDTTVAKDLTIGSPENTGTLQIENDAGGETNTTFSVDGAGDVTAAGNEAILGSQVVAGASNVGLSSAVGVAQNSGNNAIYLYAAEGHSGAAAPGGAKQSFFLSPAGGAPSSGSTVNPANLLLPTGIILQRGVTRALVDCNDLAGDAEDLSAVRDYNQYAAIGSTTETVTNSTRGGGGEMFGLSIQITEDRLTGTPIVMGVVAPGATAGTPALTCSARIETQITY